MGEIESVVQDVFTRDSLAPKSSFHSALCHYVQKKRTIAKTEKLAAADWLIGQLEEEHIDHPDAIYSHKDYMQHEPCFEQGELGAIFSSYMRTWKVFCRQQISSMCPSSNQDDLDEDLTSLINS